MHIYFGKASELCKRAVLTLLSSSDVQLILEFAHCRRCVALTTVAAGLRM